MLSSGDGNFLFALSTSQPRMERFANGSPEGVLIPYFTLRRLFSLYISAAFQ